MPGRSPNFSQEEEGREDGAPEITTLASWVGSWRCQADGVMSSQEWGVQAWDPGGAGLQGNAGGGATGGRRLLTEVQGGEERGMSVLWARRREGNHRQIRLGSFSGWGVNK